MKRKTVALMTALTLVFSISACGDKTASQAEIPDTTSARETVATTEEAEETEEESMPEETEEDIAKREMEKLQSALGGMPYYGDTANCKMTAEQATAFAQLIADGLAGDFSFRGGYDEDIISDIISWNEPFHINQVDAYINEYETNRSNVIVGDFSGEGIPYLYIFSSTEPSSFEVYGWNNNKTALVCSEEKYLRGNSSLSKQNDGTIKVVKEYFNTEVQCGDEYWWAAALWKEYDFTEGSLKQIYERALAKPTPLDSSGMFYIVENGEQTGEVAEEEYEAYIEKETHQHTLSYTCFYDMNPCTLEEMVNYLNAYASVMSDGQSVPVEIRKVDIVRHDGTGITTKGEVSQEKVNSLEILRQYMTGKMGIGGVNDGDSIMYANELGEQWEGSKNFYFALTDINNDGNQELKVSYKDADRSWNITNLFLGLSDEDSLYSIDGVNLSDGTYLCTGGSVFAVADLYVYDGTTFSLISELKESEAFNGDGYAEGYKYTLTESGATREISEEEFHSIWNDWENKHTDFSADIHLDIENIENTFQVKIDVQNSGEWLVTNAE